VLSASRSERLSGVTALLLDGYAKSRVGAEENPFGTMSKPSRSVVITGKSSTVG